MKAEDFTAWREMMGFNRVQCAEALGLSRNMPKRYEDGDAEIPLYISLACASLTHKLPPAGDKREGTPKVYRILVSLPNDLDRFFMDTLIEDAVDEHDALAKQLRRTSNHGGSQQTHPVQNVRIVRD